MGSALPTASFAAVGAAMVISRVTACATQIVFGRSRSHATVATTTVTAPSMNVPGTRSAGVGPASSPVRMNVRERPVSRMARFVLVWMTALAAGNGTEPHSVALRAALDRRRDVARAKVASSISESARMAWIKCVWKIAVDAAFGVIV